jgi:hypothetical protein
MSLSSMSLSSMPLSSLGRMIKLSCLVMTLSTTCGMTVTEATATNFSPRLRQATEQCRVRTVCDDHGQNCYTVDDCQ